MHRLFLLITGLVWAQACLAQPFLQAVDSIRKNRSIPGMTYAVFTTDQVLETGATGVRMLKSKSPVLLQHRFLAGTNTTAFTAYVAARLVQQKKIRWNSTIIAVFPELQGKIMKLYHKITLQQLLGQRAGILPYIDSLDYKPLLPLKGTPKQQRAAFTGQILKRPPVLLADTNTPIFSIAGTTIAASMLEKVSGRSWEELVAQYISKPLGIEISFGLPHLRDSTQPTGHWDHSGSMMIAPDQLPYSIAVAPATNININVQNYMVFVRDHLKALLNKKSVISTAAAQQLLFGHTGDAFGWKNGVWNKWPLAGSIGTAPSYSCYAELLPAKNLGIVVLCNSGTAGGRSAVLNVARLLREYYAR